MSPSTYANRWPRRVMASAIRVCFGPPHRRCASSALMSAFIVNAQQMLHLQLPALYTHSWPPRPRSTAPSLATGRRCMRSRGMGGNSGMVAAMVRTTARALFNSDSRSWHCDGVGWGCMSRASLASRSAASLPRASSFASPSSTSALTWAATFLTVTRLHQSTSHSTGLRSPPYTLVLPMARLAGSPQALTTEAQSEATSHDDEVPRK